MRSLDDVIASLPAERREKVIARGDKLVAEEKVLRQLRVARAYTQQNMAEALEIDQAGVSRIEKRSDMLISTMRSYVEAMGGSLKLVAEFADGPVDIGTIGKVAADVETKRKPKKTAKVRVPAPANDRCPAEELCPA